MDFNSSSICEGSNGFGGTRASAVRALRKFCFGWCYGQISGNVEYPAPPKFVVFSHLPEAIAVQLGCGFEPGIRPLAEYICSLLSISDLWFKLPIGSFFHLTTLAAICEGISHTKGQR